VLNGGAIIAPLPAARSKRASPTPFRPHKRSSADPDHRTDPAASIPRKNRIHCSSKRAARNSRRRRSRRQDRAVTTLAAACKLRRVCDRQERRRFQEHSLSRTAVHRDGCCAQSRPHRRRDARRARSDQSRADVEMLGDPFSAVAPRWTSVSSSRPRHGSRPTPIKHGVSCKDGRHAHWANTHTRKRQNRRAARDIDLATFSIMARSRFGDSLTVALLQPELDEALQAAS